MGLVAAANFGYLLVPKRLGILQQCMETGALRESNEN